MPTSWHCQRRDGTGLSLDLGPRVSPVVRARPPGQRGRHDHLDDLAPHRPHTTTTDRPPARRLPGRRSTALPRRRHDVRRPRLGRRDRRRAPRRSAPIAYGFVVLAVASWLPRSSRLAAAIVLTGVIGACGNLAYGFDAIHLSLGDVSLVDQPGAANLIKPLGLFFPLSFALVAVALARLGTGGRPLSCSPRSSPGPSPTSATSPSWRCRSTWRWWSPSAACCGSGPRVSVR